VTGVRQTQGELFEGVNAADSMSIAIRRARREDALALALLGERTFRETFASDNRPSDIELFVRQTYGENIQAHELADPKRHIFVARDAAATEPIGYLHLFEGVASALLEVGLDHARDLVEVDVVRAEPLQGALDRGADVRGATVQDPRAATGMRDQAKLRR
jgi:hypothetical protein